MRRIGDAIRLRTDLASFRSPDRLQPNANRHASRGVSPLVVTHRRLDVTSMALVPFLTWLTFWSFLTFQTHWPSWARMLRSPRSSHSSALGSVSRPAVSCPRREGGLFCLRPPRPRAVCYLSRHRLAPNWGDRR